MFCSLFLALPRSSSLFLALPRSSSLLLALARSLFLALPRSSSLFLALPRPSSLFPGLLVLFFFCFSFCSVHFRFWRFIFALFCSFSVFSPIFTCFRSVLLFLVFCRFVCPLLYFFSFFLRFVCPPRCCDLFALIHLFLICLCGGVSILSTPVFFFLGGGGACLCHMCFLGSIFASVA